jgi:glucokinase
MIEVVAADIGGTHARFAIAEVSAGRVRALGEAFTLRTGEHPGLEAAWTLFAEKSGRPLPRAAAVAFAGPVGGEVLKLTNSPWEVRPVAPARPRSAIDRLTIVNDFGAVGHAVGQLGDCAYSHICGPERGLPPEGTISIVGPGTGLGVAQLVRRGGRCDVIETEGGHIGFAPLDDVEDHMLAHLRARYGRVSAERLAAGIGLANIHESLAFIEGREAGERDEKALWAAALDGSDPSRAPRSSATASASVRSPAISLSPTERAASSLRAGSACGSPRISPAPASRRASPPRAGSKRAWRTFR